MKKTYWISCNVEPDIQHLSMDRRRFPSSFVVRPRDLARLLSNFQSSLQEITVIATDPSAVPCDATGEIGGKAVELRSYIDPSKGLVLGNFVHILLLFHVIWPIEVWFFCLQIIVIQLCTHSSGLIQLKSSYSIHTSVILWMLPLA